MGITNIININNQKLHFKQKQPYNGRPTLVFLHDSLGCTELWRDFPDKLADAAQCNLLVYDRLGYGKSSPMPTHVRPVNYMEAEAKVLNELLVHFGIEEAILFGHSDGGTIALIAAALYPKRIRAVICEAAHIFVEEVTLRGIHEAMKAYKTTDLPQRLEKYHGDNTETLFKAWTETWTRADFRDWSIEHLLPKITCPLLFIQGGDDEFGTLEQLRKAVAGVSGRAEEYIVSNVGHTPHKEAPGATLAAAGQFIRSL